MDRARKAILSFVRARGQLTTAVFVTTEAVKALRAIVRADGARRVSAERTAETWYGGNGPIRAEKLLTPSEVKARNLALAQARLIDAPIERDHHGREYLRDDDGNDIGQKGEPL